MFGNGRSTFPKSERMVSRLLMESLFGGRNSHSVVNFPLRIVYTTRERQLQEAPIQILVSVSKKHFKHAVDRNRVKRQIREAYRCNRQVRTEALPEGKQLLMACVWLSDEHCPSAEIESKMVSLMRRVGEKL
jgi:ribonuclease P protein component